VHLLHHTSLYHLLLISLVLALDFLLHVLPFVLLHPLDLLLLLLLELDVLLPVRVHVLQQINAGLVLTVPLLLALLPLLCVFLSNELVDHAFVNHFVLGLLGCELLQLDCLGSVTHSFLVLQLLKCLLAFKGSVEQLQVPLLL
jgi:hypothetical protein